MRLNFTMQTPENVQEGMMKLRKAIDRQRIQSTAV